MFSTLGFTSPNNNGSDSSSISDGSSEFSAVDASLSDQSSGRATPVPSGDPANAPAVGLSDERISRPIREMLNVNDRLRSAGVESYLDLPQIVVVGMQNSGKSSLIEALSGSNLPRASGTCTRCPIELRLKRSDGPWQCDVSLQFIYDDYGSRLGHGATIITFGPTITNPDHVEDRLRKAQQAILNPSLPPMDFLRKASARRSELSFSRNIVSVQVEGPNVADLSFYDLPGLIASAKCGRTGEVGLIEDLVVSYIEKPSCLILLTVACETDFETQGAHQLVKKYDPEGRRTIGVLTKPDRIPKGDEENWVRFVKNEEEQLDLGWFSVKQPDSIQLQQGLSWTEARDAEEEWFQSTKPWKALPGRYLQNLGTKNLVENLSKALSELMARRFPQLREEIDDLLQRLEDEFKELPPPPSNDALAEMIRVMTSFCKEVVRHTEGVSANEGLLQSINARQADFKRSLLSLAPEFKPYKRGEALTILPQLPPIKFLDGEEEDTTVSKSGLVMYVDEVMQLLKKSRTRELPDYYPYDVPKQVIEKTRRKWEVVVFSYFDNVQVIIYEHYKKLVDEHFRHFESGGLLNAVQMAVQTEIKKHYDETKERIEWLLKLESCPFTLNSRCQAEYKSKFLAYYKAMRYNAIKKPAPTSRIAPYNSGHVEDVLQSLNRMNIKDVKAYDLAKLLPEDEYEPALELMATASAYFQVSCKRFVDVASLVVDYDFVQGISSGIEGALFTAIIKDDARDRCQRLLQESPDVSARRAKLQWRYERLEEAKNELITIGW